MDKGTHGSAPQICVPASLLSLGVRPVRLDQVPGRGTNLSRRTPKDPRRRISASGKATEEGVLDVRRLTLTQSDTEIRHLGRVPPCPLMVACIVPQTPHIDKFFYGIFTD